MRGLLPMTFRESETLPEALGGTDGEGCITGVDLLGAVAARESTEDLRELAKDRGASTLLGIEAVLEVDPEAIPCGATCTASSFFSAACGCGGSPEERVVEVGLGAVALTGSGFETACGGFSSTSYSATTSRTINTFLLTT
jgi:hypothetical protein